MVHIGKHKKQELKRRVEELEAEIELLKKEKRKPEDKTLKTKEIIDFCTAIIELVGAIIAIASIKS